MVSDSTGQKLEQIEAEIAACMLSDLPGLRKRLYGLKKRRAGGRPADVGLGELEARVARSLARAERRRAHLPEVAYPPGLPVGEHRARIAAAIEGHQVTVVCGETGSGKTTQIPKICLELGRGVRGAIAHTQPRRIAARSVSARVAQELGCELGSLVGYKVRFNDRVGPDTYVKLMTDGILLAETRADRDLLAYDTIIIDEAHERSLNIDFLLGYLKQLLPRRPELKLIITSATIDPERFSRHFGDAPIVEVPGRAYPVELRYRPLAGEDDEARERDQQAAILDAVDELSRHGPGDILVFLSGEREIRETAEALRKHHPARCEVLPLFARLSADEQQRIFRAGGQRRIVLATNVAETSLTVPGIRYVVDAGFARISRYSHRTKVQRLPVERISRASADQRRGRCGRVAAGVCVRLYGEQDYLARPEFTEPEIRRTNLAAVILQMAALGLGEMERFPFVDPPDPRYVKDGYGLLQELGAVDPKRRLTELGRALARLPVDPRLGRMLLAARDGDCLREVLIIASALSVQDPRDRPLDRQQQADEAHARFHDPRSDFLAFVRLWEFYHEQARHLSKGKLRRLCRDSFLSFMRMREWHDVHQQLLGALHDMGLHRNREPAEYAAVHRALLTGLLGQIGFRSGEREYTGARGSRLYVHPGSGLFAHPPKWFMAAELVETTRLYARTLARIDPAWVEALAPHLVRRSYSEPHWEQRRAQVAASEKVTLYGLTLVAGRKVNYGPIDPGAAREIFIRAALVAGEYRSRAPFFTHNQGLIRAVEAIEEKSRRRDVLVDEQTLFEFYDALIPEGVYSGASFEKWRRRVEADDPRRLFLSREDLMRHGAEDVSARRYPDWLQVDGLRLALDYRFEPGHPADGVTATLPLAALSGLPPEPFEWLVPGMLEEKIVHLLRALPKALRRNFVPVPDYARAIVQALATEQGPLLPALSGQLRRMTGVEVPADAWRMQDLPEHLRMRFRVIDEAREELDAGRDLEDLQQALGGRAQRSFQRASAPGMEREDVSDWDFGDLSESVEFAQGGLRLQAYQALAEEGERVALRVFDTPQRAAVAHHDGLLRLYLRALPAQARDLARNLPGIGTMCLHYANAAEPPAWAGAPPKAGGNRCDGLRGDLVRAIFREAFMAPPGEVRGAAEFQRRRESGRAALGETRDRLCALVAGVLGAHHGLRRVLSGSLPPVRLRAVGDLRAHLDQLVFRGFLRVVPANWLAHYPRYLSAVQRRLERLDNNPARDERLMAELRPLWRAWEDKAVAGTADAGELMELRWLLEELRVSLFAQELRTAVPVSAKRLGERLRSL